MRRSRARIGGQRRCLQTAARERIQRDARRMRLRKLLKEYGPNPATPLSINQMFDFGQYDAPGRNRSTTLLAAAQFVHEELPVRCSQMIQDLLILPFGLSENSAIEEVVELFHTTIQEVTSAPRPKSSREELELRERIMGMLRRHRNIVTHMRSALAGDLFSHEEKLQLQPFLDRFYATRIGNRTMLAHYIELGHEKKPGWVGLINDKCTIAEVVNNAFKIASNVCSHHHPGLVIAPISVVGSLGCNIRYIESHLEYILTEIFHNSIYSTWQYHHGEPSTTSEGKISNAKPLPEIKVVIAEGKKDINIGVFDQGGGFGRKKLDSMWTHLHFPESCFTHHHNQTSNVIFGENEHDLSPLINGYSRISPRLYQNGLPVCRLYARHFGGDLAIQAMEHYGNDVFITLRKDGDYPEAIPDFTFIDDVTI